MAYINIPETDIEVGDIITADLAYKIKNNLDDLNTRINALAGAVQGGGSGMKIAEHLRITKNIVNNNVVHFRTVPAGRVARLTVLPGVFYTSDSTRVQLVIDNFYVVNTSALATVDFPAGTVIAVHARDAKLGPVTLHIVEYSN